MNPPPHCATPCALMRLGSRTGISILAGRCLASGGFRLADLGDLETQPDDGPGNRALIRDCTKAIIDAGAVPIMIGGDDSTPIPFIDAFAGHGPLTILQIDAHIDWREERYGERLASPAPCAAPPR